MPTRNKFSLGWGILGLLSTLAAHTLAEDRSLMVAGQCAGIFFLWLAWRTAGGRFVSERR
jgi:hypothetical protein